MSLVTLDDKKKALRLYGRCLSPGLAIRLRSLAQQTTWTEKQRGLVEKLWTAHGTGSTSV